jgi:hypothetical protein
MSELPLPYVPISPALKKSKRFEAFVDAADLYNDPFAEFYIHKLLLFAGEARIDGNLGNIPARRLAKECVWQGDPDAFLQALESSKWLVRDEGGDLHIGGWEKHGGRVLKERLRWRSRHVQTETPVEYGGDSAEPPQDSAGNLEEPTRIHAEPPVLKGEGCKNEGCIAAAADNTTVVSQKPLTGDVSTVEQLTERVSSWGWLVELPPTQVVVATSLLDDATMTEKEIAFAKWRVEEKCTEGRGSGVRKMGLFLHIVGEERRKVLKLPRAGSEHERVERDGRERSPPKHVFRATEKPGFVDPGIVVGELLAKLGGLAS